jgi:hypothetical protein
MKNSLQIQDSPIRLQNKTRHLALITCLLAAQGCGFAWAHQSDDFSDKPASDFSLGLAAAASAFQASHGTLPVARIPGILDSGNTQQDRRGITVEHAVADLAWNVSPYFNSALAIGWHGEGQTHVEAAWLATQWDQWRIQAGRRRVPLGETTEKAGHFDRFAFMPLSKQAILGGDWIDDGVVLHWKNTDTRASVGLWQGDVFPGGGRYKKPAPSLLLQHNTHTGFGDITLNAFAAKRYPDGRGTDVQLNGNGHSHGSLDCTQSLLQRVCFEGDANILGASGYWKNGAFIVQGTALQRDEKGTLYDQNTNVAYQGKTIGGWVDVLWQINPVIQTGIRYDHVLSRHTLSGTGTQNLANQAGLMNTAGTRQRKTLMLSWQAQPSLNVSVEAGQEDMPLKRNTFFGVRMVWFPPRLTP